MTAPARASLTFPRVLRSEWLKLATLRSTWLTLGGAVVVLVLAAGLIANRLHGNLLDPRPFGDPGDRDVLTTPLRGFGITQLIVGVLGVLTVTGEYSTGMIRSSLTAVPRRLPVLVAKLAIFALVGFAAMAAASFTAFLVSQRVLGRFGVGLSAPHALQVCLGLAGYLTLVGLLGVGLGFVLRSTAGGVASLVGILLVAPGILAALGTSWATTTSHYLPLSAGQAMFSDHAPTAGELSAGGGLLTMTLWVFGAAIAAAAALVRRDA